MNLNGKLCFLVPSNVMHKTKKRLPCSRGKSDLNEEPFGPGVRSNTAALLRPSRVHYSRLRMAPINLRTSRIRPINYTASVKRTPINVRNGNRFKRMVGMVESVGGGGLFFFPFHSAKRWFLHLLITWQWRISSARGERFPDLGGDLVPSADKSS